MRMKFGFDFIFEGGNGGGNKEAHFIAQGHGWIGLKGRQRLPVLGEFAHAE
jgi:hypothetical protein